MYQLSWFTLDLSFTNLVAADASCHIEYPEPKCHTNTATNIEDRFSDTACCGTLLRKVDDLLQESNGISD
jgi:hypothetical protein